MISKIKTIIFSRIQKKPNNESWIENRRAICKKCEWNSLNQTKYSFKIKIIKFLSDFYSYVTFNKKVDILGNCTACSACSIYYKTAENLEQCEKNKWKRVNLKKAK